MKQMIVVLGFFVFASLAYAFDPPPFPSYSADITFLKKGEVQETGKQYLGKNGMRQNVTEGKNKRSVIFNFDKEVSWTKIEKDNTYVEMPLKWMDFIAKQNPNQEQCTTGETIQGIATNKCSVDGKLMGQKVKSYLWRAKPAQYKGLVVKSCDQKMKYCQELSNIQLGQQSVALFQEPSGEKINLGKGFMKGVIEGLGSN
ncbi:MAG: hypothetical protein Q7S68_04340 [Deltaproteobacteria bacterium]|nr:hypothetical protein [Deltaproteobacteria bacterium]